MIEVDFKDRLPKYPGRVKMTPVPGQMDTFTMERMDEPTEKGTPLDKATFESFLKSRLTGRYYQPTVKKETINSRNNVTANPIPNSGWIRQSLTSATNGEYTITASGSFATDYALERATDGNQNTEWQSNEYLNGDGVWWQVKLPVPIVVTSINVNLEDLSGYGQTFSFQGSSNGLGWTELTRGEFDNITGMKGYTFNNTTEYSYYRMYFEGYNEYNAIMIEFAISNYSISTYKNTFSILGFVPSSWTIGQRIMIKTPSNVTTAGILQNSLNGVAISTILQPSRKYELIYNGSTFDAKEV